MGRLDPRSAYFWSDGALTDLGALLAEPASAAWMVNEADQVVGTSGYREAWLWEPVEGFTPLGPGSAEGISDGQVPLIVGDSPRGTPVVWTLEGSSWARTPLPTDPTHLFGSAYAVIEPGIAVGFEILEEGVWTATRWTQGDAGWTREALGALPDASGITFAAGVNARGQVSGSSGNRGFLWEEGEMKALEPPPSADRSFAYRINERGDVAGGAVLAGSLAGAEAVLWSDLVPIELGRPEEADYCLGRTLNDVGQAAGLCSIDGEHHPTIWELGPAVTRATAIRLQEFVANGDISDLGVAESLRRLLDAALNDIRNGKPDLAVRKLGAYVRLVEAQAGKSLTPSAAITLTVMAETAQAYLGP